MSDERPDLPASHLTRRNFLRASAATAVASFVLPGCKGEERAEQIVPYVTRPPEVVPGVTRMYATAGLRSGVAIGLLGATREGRPIKLEGNPAHPSSLGATGALEQALPYTLYDTDRLGTVEHRGAPSSFDAFARAFDPSNAERRYTRAGGDGLYVWLPPTSSPLHAALIARLQERLPRARIVFDPSNIPAPEWAATQRAFGRVLAPQYRFDEAERVLALDADVLSGQPGSTRWAHDWAQRRRPDAQTPMSRCYAVDATPTGTSAAFDHRLTVRSSEVGLVAAALLAALDASSAPRAWIERSPHGAWIEAVARDLAQHRGRTIVVAGERQPAYVHLIALAINQALGNLGRTITFTASPWYGAGEPAFDLGPVLDALDAGAVDTLVCAGTNPAYTASSVRFAERARRAAEVVALAQFPNETARLATWVIPELHVLERWGDARGHDGTWTTIQPLIRPLFAGHSLERLLLALSGMRDEDVRGLLAQRLREAGHEIEDVLSQGFVPDSAFPPERAEPDPSALASALSELERASRIPARVFELELRPDPRLGDGAHAENAWLQELPETMTKLTWDNAALIAPADADELGLEEGDVVEITTARGTVQLPVQPAAGQARRTIVAWLGFGRREGGRVARGVGVDLNRLRSGTPWLAATLRKTGSRRELARTQRHFALPPEQVPIVLRTTLDDYRRDPHFAEHHNEDPPSLHPELLHGSPQWGMAIDLSLCTGCQSCVVACQAENNVPVVGKTQVALGREMHWLRIDRYVHEAAGEREARTSLQPMLCVHCEKAPCEYVCPVNATVHSPDGLNEMVYNRCVGTRFCSNNCPYKVRRFNWYDFHANEHEPETLIYNPDVTVRRRGVMEKCTYCVQRIRRAGITARQERREIADGEVVTACAQACATSAIVFGNIADPNAAVTRLHADDRTFAVLNNLNTRPRTRYLARIDNVNPEVERA